MHTSRNNPQQFPVFLMCRVLMVYLHIFRQLKVQLQPHSFFPETFSLCHSLHNISWYILSPITLADKSILGWRGMGAKRRFREETSHPRDLPHFARQSDWTKAQTKPEVKRVWPTVVVHAVMGLAAQETHVCTAQRCSTRAATSFHPCIVARFYTHSPPVPPDTERHTYTLD
jgi:hypothetical protein